MGSLSLTVGRTGMSAAELHKIATRVVFCAQVVSSALSAQGSGALWTGAAPNPQAEAVPLRPEDNRLVSAAILNAPSVKGRRTKTAG